MSHSSSSPLAKTPPSSPFVVPTPDSPFNTPLWVKGLGGSGSETGNAIAVDGDGNTYVTGKLNGTASLGSTSVTSTDVFGDVFVTKLDASGTLLWSKNFGGVNLGVGQGISVDASGNVYVTGHFQDNRPLGSPSPNPNVLFGNTTFQNQGISDIFALKLSGTDGSVSWAKSFGGSGIDMGYGISADADGNSYITGTFASPSVTFGSTTLTNKGLNDIFAVKLDTTGNVAWAKNFGGSSNDSAFGISVDRNGGVYLTGDFQQTVNFGTATLTSNGGSDVFALKLNSNDGNTIWAKSFGGAGFDSGQGIATDSNGNAYLTGFFANSNVAFGNVNLTSQSIDVLAVKLNSNDGSVAWAKNFGGTNADAGYAISVDGSGNVYLTGAFNSTKATFGNTTLTKSGDPTFTDGFSVKLNSIDGSTAWARSFGGASSDSGYGIAADRLGYAYITGEFVSNSLTAGTKTIANQGISGTSDGVVLKYDQTASSTLTLTNSGVNYTEKASPVLIASGATIADSSSTLNGSSLTVRLAAGGALGDRLSILTDATITLDGRIIKYNGNRIGTYLGGIGAESLVITFDSAIAATAQAVLQRIAYSSTADNLANSSRSVEVSFINASGIGSNTPTRTILVTSVNDAPSIGITQVLYDGSTNRLPTSNGADGLSITSAPWLAYRDSALIAGTATQTATAGKTTLTTDGSVHAGYINYTFAEKLGAPITFTSSLTNPKFPVLDRDAGYLLSFNAKVLSESHSTSANANDRNGDGKADRAGFSVIALSQDKRGIELGFWTDRIWAQDDGTSQATPSLEPDGTATGNTRTLFTQAEFTTLNTTADTQYDLAVKGDNYQLFANGTLVLSGRLRDYSAFIPTPQTIGGIRVNPPNPYNIANLVFLGDDTPTAQASVQLNKLAVTTSPTVLPAQTIAAASPLFLPGGFVNDLDGITTALTTTLSATGGVITLRTDIAGGLTAADIVGNGTRSVRITAIGDQISNTLFNTTGLKYQSDLTFSGPETLTFTATDSLGASTRKTLSIVVTPKMTNLSANAPDFNGDGYADLVWRNSVTGENGIWYLKGTAFAGSDGSAGYVPRRGIDYDLLLSVADPDWAIVGYGDFNGDKKTDIVWRNGRTGQDSVWYLKGKDFAGGDAQVILGRDYDYLLTVDDRNWNIEGVGDFNGDQKSDLIWRNLATGQNIIWFMDGKNFLGGGSTAEGWVDGRDYRYLFSIADRAWKIEAVADMNGDGRSDLIWRNYATGENAIWYIKDTNFQPNGSQVVLGVDYDFFFPLNDSTWHIEAATDLNNDGKNDIVWRNYATGRNSVWYFDGSRFKINLVNPKEGQDYDYLPSLTDLNWRIGDVDRFN